MRFRHQDLQLPADTTVRRMYHRMVSHWVSDLLQCPPQVTWTAPDPVDDYRNRDWKQLYAGSVLDD